MKPIEGSRAHRAIELIRQAGAARSSWLAEQFGTEPTNISGLLAPYCEDGTLVACKVEKPGTRSENEYRLGLAGAGHRMGPVPVAHNGGAPVVRRPTIDAPSRLHLDAEAARHRAPETPSPAPPSVGAPPAPIVAMDGIDIDKGHELRPVETPAPRAEGFRVALANDASLILWLPGQAQPVDLRPEQTRALVDYLRKLGAVPASVESETEIPALLMVQAQ